MSESNDQSKRPEILDRSSGDPPRRRRRRPRSTRSSRTACCAPWPRWRTCARRTQREVEDARKFAVTGFARDLLEVGDNLGRALASVPPEARQQSEFMKNLVLGVEMTERSLPAAFEKHQVRRIEPKKGEKFDHKLHQAMFEVPTAELAPGISCRGHPGRLRDRRPPATAGSGRRGQGRTGCCGGRFCRAARQPIRHHGLTAATRTGNGGGVGHG